VSLNGYFAGPNNDLSWAHTKSGDAEFQNFVKGNASGDGTLMFGRVTYQMMASYWPTPMAAQNDPVVADRMNSAEKIVFSRTLQKADWENTRVIADDLVESVRSLKDKNGPDLVILGSGSIVTQLTDARLVDHYQIVVKSIALTGGRPLFEGARNPVNLRLTESRPIGRDNVVLDYELD
jgi:dihydrofolate reductase